MPRISLDQSGVGTFNATDLAKKLSGKAANVISRDRRDGGGPLGQCIPQRSGDALSAHLPGVDEPARRLLSLWCLKNQLTPGLANRGSDPGLRVRGHDRRHDGRSTTCASNRRPLATLATDRSGEGPDFYKARFANPGAFTYVFVGNVTLETLKPLVERYLASLPSNGRKETWKDVETGPPPGVVERTVKKGMEPKADTHIVFSGPFVYTPENRLTMRALVALVQIKLDDVLREQLGGTYSPEAGSNLSRIPRPEYQIIIDYGSSPENVDKLSTSFFAIIDALKQGGPAAADVDKVKEQLIRTHEVEVKTNGYWAGNIAARDQSGEDIAGLGDAYTEMIKALTPAMRSSARRSSTSTRRITPSSSSSQRSSPRRLAVRRERTPRTAELSRRRIQRKQAATNAWTSRRTPSATDASSGACSTQSISCAMRCICGSFMPRVVTAAVPIRIPLVTNGDCVSFGTVFLLTVIAAASRAICATFPVSMRLRRSTSIR